MKKGIAGSYSSPAAQPHKIIRLRTANIAQLPAHGTGLSGALPSPAEPIASAEPFSCYKFSVCAPAGKDVVSTPLAIIESRASRATAEAIKLTCSNPNQGRQPTGE
jgi:hypothetical protein